MTFNKSGAAEIFDHFLMEMDDQLEWLTEEAETYGIELEFTQHDLTKLEKLFDLMAEKRDKEYISRIVVTFARYLGEIFRKNNGGKWELHLEDEKNVNFNTPVIAGYSKIEGLEFAPLLVMRAYSLRKKEGTLAMAVDANVNPNPLDLSKFTEG